VVWEFDARGAEADALLVDDAAGGHFFAKIYRKGIEPKSEVLERLSRNAPEHVIRLFEYGPSDGYWYELLEYASAGTLREFLEREWPQLGSPMLKTILRELTNALAHIHALGIEHRDLKPENILVRSQKPLDLVLTDFGIASIMDASLRFSSSHRTIPYAPPEALTGAVYQTRWDYWSLGIILVELLTGRHPFEGLSEQVVNSRLATLATDQLVEGVTTASWRNLCRGLLRRDPKLRWSKAEIDRWFENPDDPALVVAEESAPGRAAFRFLGSDYHTQEELALAFAANWDDAADIWRRRNQQLRDWLRHELGLREVTDELERIDKARDLDLDAQLFRVIVTLNPQGPFSFKGLELTEEKLTELANNASGDSRAGEVLRALSRSRILSAADERLGTPRFAGIEQGWREAMAEYERLRQHLSSQGVHVGACDLSEERLTVLLAATTPGNTVSEVLRARAGRAATRDARECPWFRVLDNPDKASPPALLLMPLVAGAAEEHTSEQRRQREAERAQRQAVAAEQRRVGIAIVVGFIAGALIGAFVGALVCAITLIPGSFVFLIVEEGLGTETAERLVKIYFILFMGVGAIVLGVIGALNLRDWARPSASPIVVTIIGLILVGVLFISVKSHYEAEEKRMASILADVQLGEKMVDGKLLGKGTTFRGNPLRLVVAVRYNNAKRGDKTQSVIYQNNRPIKCSGKIKYPSTYTYCEWNEKHNLYLKPGNYTIKITLNDKLIRSLAFRVVNQ
jgi:hypothetical protein